MSTRAPRRPLAAALWLLLFQLLIVLLLVPGDWMRQVIAKEHAWLWEDMSQPTAEWIEQKALAWYDRSVVRSGFLDATYNHLIPTEAQRAQSRGMENIGTTWFPLVESRLQAFFSTVYQIFLRLALLLAWLPFFTITAIPAVLDGMMAWKARQASFAYASPVMHRVSLHVVLWSMWSLLVLLIAPVPISPAVLPAFGIVIPLALSFMTAHTQKRV